MNATLTLVWLKLHGRLNRFVLCTPEERPHMGHPTFDFMAYFGFGSGDFHSQTPARFHGIKVALNSCPGDSEVSKAYIAAMLAKPTDKFCGFFTSNGTEFFELTPDDSGHDLFHLPELDWRYYAQISSSRDIAKDYLRTLNRRHILLDSHEQQSELLNTFVDLIEVL